MSPEELTLRFEGKEPYDVLHFALSTFGDCLRIAASMGMEDMVLIHEAARAGRALGMSPRVFLLDTGRLHQETYELVDRMRERYDVAFDVFAPETVSVERLLRQKGPNSFYRSVENRKECCGIRKVEPLGRALAGASAWVTGLRREQSIARADVNSFESDADHRTDSGAPLLKINPLSAWTSSDLRAFVEANDVPVHALHAQGYPSIGCAPCTRATRPGEDERAGRWWWEEEAQKECGLHSPKHLAALRTRYPK